MKKIIKQLFAVLIILSAGFSTYAAPQKQYTDKNTIPINPFGETSEEEKTEKSTSEDKVEANKMKTEDASKEDKATIGDASEKATLGDAAKKDKASLGDASKKDKSSDGAEKTDNKKKLIIAIVLFVVLVILIILIIIIASGKKKKRVAEDSEDESESTSKKKGYTIQDSTITGIPIVIDVYKSGEMINSIQANVDSSLIIGRDSICDVVINNENLSSQHLVIEYSDESFFVQDLNTKNGTFFNGIKMKHKRRLEKGDRLKIGEMELVIRW